MSCSNLTLKGVEQNIGYDNITNMLEFNLKAYYDWNFLSQLGAWSEVSISTSGIYGGDFATLNLVYDPMYTDGQVWQSTRKDWVWETGVNYADITGGIQNPLPVGTPTINGVAATGSYYINYPDGRIIFNNAISTSSAVKVQYSYRTIQTYLADNAPWWRELQYNSLRPDLFSISGHYGILGPNRVQLPAVVIEAQPRGETNKGWQLGSEAQISSRNVDFHIISENRYDRNNLMDIINLQSDKSIVLFNSNTLAIGGYPLDYRGMLTGTKQYPDFIEDHRFRTCRMADSKIREARSVHPSLYIATVSTVMEVIV